MSDLSSGISWIPELDTISAAAVLSHQSCDSQFYSLYSKFPTLSLVPFIPSGFLHLPPL